MNDFLELFTDFDKKFLRLIGHLVTRPKRVLDSIVNDSKEYTAPFKFYSYIASFTLFIVILLNHEGSVVFWDEEYVLPTYWADYYLSQSDFLLTMVPIIGFIELILIVSVFSFLFFRRPKLTFLGHIKYITYLIPLLFLYYILLLYPFDHVVTSYSDTVISGFILITFMILPAIYLVIGFAAFAGNLIIKLAKSAVVIAAAIYIFQYVFFDLEVERIIHDRLFYSDHLQDEILPDIEPSKRNLLVNTTPEGLQMYAYESGYDKEQPVTYYSDDSYTFFLRSDTHLLPVNELSTATFFRLSMFKFYQQPLYVIAENYDWQNEVYQETNLWRLTPDTSKIVDQTRNNYNTLSYMASRKKELYLSGYSQDSLPAIYKITNDNLSPILNLPYENSHIDEFIPLSNDSLIFLILLYETNKEDNLISISLSLVDIMEANEELTAKIYDNRFSKFPAVYSELEARREILNPRLFINQDTSRFYVFYQLVTDQTFELQMHCFDANLNELFTKHYTTEEDLTYFDDYTLGDAIYVSGRIFSLVNKGLFDYPYSYPFVAKFDLNKGNFIDMNIINDFQPANGYLMSTLYYPMVNIKVDGDSLKILYQDNELFETTIAKF